MKVTNEMVAAAVKQAVKEKLLPTHATMDTYTRRYMSVKRVLEAALEKEG
jgi:hypothetical protein